MMEHFTAPDVFISLFMHVERSDNVADSAAHCADFPFFCLLSVAPVQPSASRPRVCVLSTLLVPAAVSR